ncbi:hypothetical protein CDAR_475361 [Caerostris darwini]|uniref:Uncharacterized protein n=1 Tax=Caerostris darwini TaxID=1538125 RepID=A0AAV4PCA4_9ARAC|nr:hypothetical protein CDAR_475361 [Caerostris darwini]
MLYLTACRNSRIGASITRRSLDPMRQSNQVFLQIFRVTTAIGNTIGNRVSRRHCKSFSITSCFLAFSPELEKHPSYILNLTDRSRRDGEGQ